MTVFVCFHIHTVVNTWCAVDRTARMIKICRPLAPPGRVLSEFFDGSEPWPGLSD